MHTCIHAYLHTCITLHSYIHTFIHTYMHIPTYRFRVHEKHWETTNTWHWGGQSEGIAAGWCQILLVTSKSVHALHHCGWLLLFKRTIVTPDFLKWRNHTLAFIIISLFYRLDFVKLWLHAKTCAKSNDTERHETWLLLSRHRRCSRSCSSSRIGPDDQRGELWYVHGVATNARGLRSDLPQFRASISICKF